jgi:hypothetical protein
VNKVYYCIRMNGTGVGTQFNSWVKMGGIDFELSPTKHSGASSASVRGGVDSYVYNSVLMGSLEGESKYALEFWAYAYSGATTLARYAIYDTINHAYLNDAGQWLYATPTGGVPTGGIIAPSVSQVSVWKQVVKVFKTLPNAQIQLRFYPLPGSLAYNIDDLTVTSAHDFSMLAWVRANANQPGGVLFSQVSNVSIPSEQPRPQGINWSVSTANALTMGMYSSGSQLQGGSLSITPTVSIADGKWHQVALSVDRTGNYSVYLDGVRFAQAPFTLGSLESNETFYIGNPGSSGFSGELGEVRFYKRALAPADVKDHYNGWFQQQCQISMAFSYNGTVAQNLTAAYNADLRIRKLLPETSLSMPFDVNISSDDRGMIVDYSRFLGAGTKTGATWTPYGKVAGAYNFTGLNDRILLPSALISGAGDFTLSAWIYPTNVTAGYIMGNNGDGNTGGVKLYVFNSGLSMAIIGNAVTTPVYANNWYHVVASRKGSVVKLYVNGTLAQTGTITSPVSSARNFAIGNAPDHSREHFQGVIDEVRVFSRTLTDDEILSLYNDNALASSQALPLSQK